MMRQGYKYKLTRAQHREIRAKYASTKMLSTRDPEKHTYDTLCIEYKVSRDTIWKILNRYHQPVVPDEEYELDA